MRFRWRIHAFMIMRNHFHLAVETPEPNLSEGMKWLQGTWAVRFNRFRGEAGRPFQGRYKAKHVEPGDALAQVAHYIHLNPVRAGIIPVEGLLKYRGSSLPRFAGPGRPAWLEPATVLRESGGLADSADGWRLYVEYLGVLTEEEERTRGKKFAWLSRGWAIGSEAFCAGLQLELAKQVKAERRFELLGADEDALLQARSELWAEKLRVLAVELGVELDRLPCQKSAFSKVRLAAAMKTLTSVSNRWLADRLGMGTAASVSSLVSGFRRDGGMETLEFRTIVSRFAS